MNTLELIKLRFESNSHRHIGLSWSEVESTVVSQSGLLNSIQSMEETGGEPDVVLLSDGYYFCDCSPESPVGRRSFCYDDQALISRKKFKPKNSAIRMATDLGVNILNEDQYRKLQEYGEFDTKTSSWILTPKNIRELGGALFADRRYDTVFVYHNGAESYYASRAFRSCVKFK